MITPFFFLSLFFFLFARADDLQEALVNRNMRAIGPVLFRSETNQRYFLSHVLSGNFTGFVNPGDCVQSAIPDYDCVLNSLSEYPSSNPGQGFCVTDFDCTWRLGSITLQPLTNENIFDEQTNSFNSFTGIPFNEALDYFANRVFNYYQAFNTDGSRSNGFPDCTNYIIDSTSGFECIDIYDFLKLEHQHSYYLYQTAVAYPDLRCISGRCVHFNDLFPGYGKDYCLNQYSINSRPQGQCPIPGMACGAVYQTNPQSSSNYLPFTPFQESTLGVVELRNDKASFVYDPDSFGNPPALAYSTDPRDQVSTCSCAHDSQCGEGMKCLKGQCYCTNSTQCLFHSSGPQVCLTNAAVMHGSQQSTVNVGSCSCVVGSSESCNYNGICTSLQQAFQRTPSNNPFLGFESEYGFSTYYSVEQYALGATKTPTSAGRCECFGQVPMGRTWNETVVGNACETDLLRDRMCAGHGKPLCTSGGPAAVSLNKGGIIGTYCSQSDFHSRGFLVCQCDLGWGPDFPGIDPLGNKIFPCSIQIACSFTSGAGVEVNGYCECAGDFFQQYTISQLELSPNPSQSGFCFQDCSLLKSTGRGVCFYNSNHLPTGWASHIPYNNDVQCLAPGWMTQYIPNNAARQYFDICFKCTVSNPLLPGIGSYLTLEGPDVFSFCNVPFNVITQPLGSQEVCGLGTWQAAGYCSCLPFTCTCINSICTDGPGVGHSCDLNSKVLDTQGNKIQLYQPQSPVPYCAATCLYLTQSMADPATPNEFNAQQPKLCGGPVRGLCVADGVGGSVCMCQNGYRGLSCEHAICPRSRGRICSNNGVCDEFSGFCVCGESFIGTACQFRKTECGNSQTVLSLPLPDNSIVDY